MQLKTDGIVLSDRRIEDDRVLTILTREQGVITAFANGANRIRNRLAASTELLCYSQFILFLNRGRTIVDSADSIHIFFGIRGDLVKLALASYCAEITKELAPQGEPSGSQLSLLLNCLSFIENGKRDSRQLKALLELRLLTLAGYMPQLVGCRKCSCFEEVGMLFLPLHGELLCGNCAGPEDKLSGYAINPGALAAMRHIIYSPPEKLFSFKLSDSGFDSLAAASERFLIAQLEKQPGTLDFYTGLKRDMDSHRAL